MNDADLDRLDRRPDLVTPAEVRNLIARARCFWIAERFIWMAQKTVPDHRDEARRPGDTQRQPHCGAGPEDRGGTPADRPAFSAARPLTAPPLSGAPDAAGVK